MERREGALPSCPILNSATYALFLFSPHLPSLLSSIVSLSPSLPPSYQLPPPPTSARSQHGSPHIVFPESSKVDESLLIRAGYCMISVGMDELICARECVHNFVCLFPAARVYEHIEICGCVWQYF